MGGGRREEAQLLAGDKMRRKHRGASAGGGGEALHWPRAGREDTCLALQGNPHHGKPPPITLLTDSNFSQ